MTLVGFKRKIGVYNEKNYDSTTLYYTCELAGNGCGGLECNSVTFKTSELPNDLGSYLGFDFDFDISIYQGKPYLKGVRFAL